MEHLLRAGPGPFKATHLARAGRLEEAEKVLQALPGFGFSPWFPVCAAAYDKIVRGELALARGQTAEAIRLLEDGVASVHLVTAHRACSSAGSGSLARALEQQGEWQRALRVLEEAELDRKAVFSTDVNGTLGNVTGALGNVTGALGLPWMRGQRHRAELLRKLGRDPEAREIEAELRELLAYADADHAILRDLNQREDGLLSRR